MADGLRLGDHCTKIGSGATPRGGKETYLPYGPVSLIRSQNVLNERFSHNGLAYISEEQAALLQNVEVLPGDVLLNITGDSVARACQVDPDVLPARVNQHVAIIRPRPERIDPRFLRYFLVSPEMQAHMLAFAAAGATRHALTKGMIESFRIPALSIDEQRAIASILGALDDKIDLNRRMNETLEAIAWAIFKDWFVDFGPTRSKIEGRAHYLAPEIWALFPDRLDDEGKPEGWRRTDIGSVGRVVTGKTPTTTEFDNFNGDYPFITIPDLNGRIYVEEAERTLSEKGATAIKGSLLPARSVMMSCIATVGRCGITTKRSFTNQQINSVVCAEDIEPEYLYWVFRNLGNEIERAGGGGSVYTNVSKSRFSAIEILVPPKAIQKEFVGPWFERHRDNVKENTSLSALRNLLLPKLMSGEIRVKGAEKAVEAVA